MYCANLGLSWNIPASPWAKIVTCFSLKPTFITSSTTCINSCNNVSRSSKGCWPFKISTIHSLKWVRPKVNLSPPINSEYTILKFLPNTLACRGLVSCPSIILLNITGGSICRDCSCAVFCVFCALGILAIFHYSFVIKISTRHTTIHPIGNESR